jgi:hypothetical protein
LLDMVHLENRLTDILGVRVDLTPVRAMKDRVRERAARRRCLPFKGADESLRDIADARPEDGCGCRTQTADHQCRIT